MKKTIVIIMLFSLVVSMSGCATMPEKKYLDRMPPEDIEGIKKDMEFNRGMWQAGSAASGALIGMGDGRMGTQSTMISIAFTSLAFMGLASLCNLHTYRNEDPERNGFFTGVLAGAAAAAVFSSMVIKHSIENPGQFSGLAFITPLSIVPSAFAGGGLGAAVGKLFGSGKD